MKLSWKQNLGYSDRIIRVFIGLVLLTLALTGLVTGWWAAAAIIFALFQFAEAYYSY